VETAFLAPEAVLFDDRHGEVHHLNPSATAVWLLLDGDLSLMDVAAELSDIFGVPESVVLPDVQTTVAEFRRRGLLAGADRPAPETQPDGAPQRLETLVRPPNP
jgi:PqqD family protein of HPr-rel-A system